MAIPAPGTTEADALLARHRELVTVLEREGEATDSILRVLTLIEESEARRTASSASRVENLKKELEFLKSALSSHQDTVLSIMKEDSMLAAQLNKRQEILDIEIKKREEHIKAEIANGKTVADLSVELKQLKEIKDYRKVIADLAQQENNANEKGKEAVGAILNSLGIKAKDQKLSLLESIMVGELSVQTFGKAIGDMVSIRNIAASLGAKIVESSIAMAKGMDEARASIYKLSGGTTELSTEIMHMSDAAKDAQVPFADLSKSYGALMKNSSNFTSLTAEQRKQLSMTVAQMEKLGASSDVSAKNISIFTQSLNLSGEEANTYSLELVALSNKLQVSLEDITSGFGSAANTMVVYGKGAVEQFKMLAAESKALGIAVNDLIGIVSKSDTFQGAAEQAGRLNAILGGGLLNSSQLLTASEGERIKMIRNAVMESNKDFASLSKYEQIAIANAAGIKDMTTAQKLFNGSMDKDKLDAYTSGLNSLGMTQEQMQEHTLNSQTAQEKMRITMEKFAIAMTPVINFVHAIIDGFNKMGTTGTVLVTTIFGIVATLKVLHTALLVVKAAEAATTAVNTIFGASLQFTAASARTMLMSMGAIVAALIIIGIIMHATNSPAFYLIFFTFGLSILFAGQMAEKSKYGLLALGASLLMVGIGVHLAATGLAQLADSFSKLNPSQLRYLALVIGILTIALLAMFVGLGILVYTGLGLAAAGVLLAFGAAMLMAGAGALLFGMGMSMVIDSLAGLTQNIIGLMLLPTVLYATAAAMISFAMAMLSLVPILYFGAAPMLAFVGLLYLLGKALDGISPEKSVAIKTTVDSVKEITTAARNVQAKDLDNLEEIVEQIHKYNVEATINRALNITAPFKELIDAIAGQTDSVNASARKESTIVMKLNDREFGRAVISTMNEYGTVNTSIRKTTPAGSNS